MGCCSSQESSDPRTKEIERQIEKDLAYSRKEVKMLLLGAGESGKSTILKQMKLIHDNGYNNEEREAFREVVFCNTIQSMRAILDAMSTLGIELAPEQAENKQIILNQPAQMEPPYLLPPEVIDAIKQLWQDQGVLECFSRSREYQLNDSAQYYFDSIDRIGEPDYIPTDQDVLRTRVKSTGITETLFRIGDLTYRLLDVGGQRSERKKWMHCFEGVTAVVFMAALSEYDQVLIEDEMTNRMEEALTLFDSICNSRWFVSTSIILFLNKIDLFKAKLPHSPISQVYPEFAEIEQSTDRLVEPACEFFKNKFLSLNKNREKRIYTHYTCATDTTQIKFVMAAVNDIIMQANLKTLGFM